MINGNNEPAGAGENRVDNTVLRHYVRAALGVGWLVMQYKEGGRDV